MSAACCTWLLCTLCTYLLKCISFFIKLESISNKDKYLLLLFDMRVFVYTGSTPLIKERTLIRLSRM